TGPDFRKGVHDCLPTGNVDITPTIAWILGVEPKHRFSGRVLTEALAPAGPMTISFEPHDLEASYHADGLTWKQYLDYSEVNGVVYFDEGNGDVATNAPADKAGDSLRQKETAGARSSASH